MEMLKAGEANFKAKRYNQMQLLRQRATWEATRKAGGNFGGNFEGRGQLWRQL